MRTKFVLGFLVTVTFGLLCTAPARAGFSRSQQAGGGRYGDTPGSISTVPVDHSAPGSGTSNSGGLAGGADPSAAGTLCQIAGSPDDTGEGGISKLLYCLITKSCNQNPNAAECSDCQYPCGCNPDGSTQQCFGKNCGDGKCLNR